MNIEQVLSLLPKELLNDSYFEYIRDIIINYFKTNNINSLTNIIVSDTIYNTLLDKDKNNFIKSSNDTLIHFNYISYSQVISVGIKQQADEYQVYLEVQDKDTINRTILVKSSMGSIIETKKTTKKDGYYTNYEYEVYYYDTDYNALKVDTESLKDEQFSEEFGIPLQMSRFMRYNFSKYAINLSRSATELKMKRESHQIPREKYFLFKGPTSIKNLKNYILSLYLENNKDNYPKFLNRLDNIINKLSAIINPTSEILISNNIIISVLPSILGISADGYYIEGFIIEKNDNKFILYELKITTNDIEHNKQEITKEELEELLTINPANANNQDIINFLNSFNRN